MAKISVKWNEAQIQRLQQRLNGLSTIRFDAVVKKNTTQMLNRARQSGGTPVDTGRLRQSSHVSGEGYEMAMGYSAEYAPHVEYGHRTRGGGYVQGQHFLQRNLETQKPIYQSDLVKAIEKAMKGGK